MNINIPAPKVGRKKKYDFSTLQQGERMEIKKSERLSATQSAYKYGKDNNKSFAVRTLEDGIFIYRTK